MIGAQLDVQTDRLSESNNLDRTSTMYSSVMTLANKNSQAKMSQGNLESNRYHSQNEGKAMLFSDRNCETPDPTSVLKLN